MEYAISFMWIGIELLCILLFESSFLTKRIKNKAIPSVFLVSWVLIFCLRNTPLLSPFSNIFSFFIIFLFSCYIFTGKWYAYLFLLIAIFLFSAIMDTAISYGTSALLHISPSKLVWMKSMYSFVGTMGKLFVLLCVWILFRAKHSRGFTGIHGKWFALTILFPIISLVILATNYYNNFRSAELSPQIVVISIILALANVGIVYLIHTLEQATIREQEFALLRQQMAHQQESFIALENNYRLQRKSSHEFERHIQTLHELLNRNEIETARDYVSQLRRDRALRVYCVNTHHPVLDVILNQKYQIAKENGIHMQIQISDLSAVKIPTEALVILFSNLLDNAIEACQKLTTHKEIRCTILYKEALYISICNTSPAVQIENGTLLSNKSDSIDHGYGIPAIKLILEQLNAEYTFDYKNQWFQFVAEVPTTE